MVVRFKWSFLLVLIFVWSAGASATSLSISATADNTLHSAWVVEDSVITQNILISDTDWKDSTSFALNFDPNKHVEIYFWTENSDPRPLTPDRNPGGFLADISSADSMFDNIITSSAWEVSLDLANWSAATQWGQNGDTSTIWYEVNNFSSLSGIALDANWIWYSVNFASNQPGVGDPVYFRYELTPVPEPTTLALLALGGASLFARRRNRLA